MTAVGAWRARCVQSQQRAGKSNVLRPANLYRNNGSSERVDRELEVTNIVVLGRRQRTAADVDLD